MALEPLIRPAESTDAAAIAEVWLRSFKAALPAVRPAHTDDEVRRWMHDVLVPTGTVSVVEVHTTVVGLLALASGWIEQMYIDPDWQRRGIGARLVGLAWPA
jgi:GNAT superfamily N-acetyltransferase